MRCALSNQAPTKLIAKPTEPTMRISFASLISSISTNLAKREIEKEIEKEISTNLAKRKIQTKEEVSTNLFIASTKIEKQRATRKTALIKAPTTWDIQQMMFVGYFEVFSFSILGFGT